MDLAGYFKFMLALGFVLALFGFAAWAAKRMLPSMRVGARPGRRLSVVEIAVLDSRRRLVLVRRDDVEHLLLLGGAADLVIERGIGGSTRFADHLSPSAEEPK
jgi:flagellar protein FliO/FliZ